MSEKSISNLARCFAITTAVAIVIAGSNHASSVDLVAVCSAAILAIYSAGYFFKILELYYEMSGKQNSVYRRMQELDRQADKLANEYPMIAEEINNSPSLKKLKQLLRNFGNA